MPFLAGLGLGFSLIIAIGAQNLFVLRQGIRREHVFGVAAICSVSDVLLILAGVSGIGAAVAAAPWLVGAVRWAGAVFLVGYGVLAARRAIRPTGDAFVTAPTDGTDRWPTAEQAPSGQPGTLVAARPATAALPVVMTCLALTWLNPHVYLDTVFLLGSVANAHGDDRWWFALGATGASLTWFFSLAYGARYLGRWLSGVRAWRALDAVIAIVMIGLGISLVVG